MAEQRPDTIWTPAQRGVLIAFVLVFCGLLLTKVYLNRQYISNPPPAAAARPGQTADQLDPNFASWQDLSVLPQLGEKRAKEIVAYREQFRADRRGETAFARAEDLLKVKGIGAAMVDTLRPYLTFASTRPTSRVTTTYNAAS
jgi:hypothetical protein